MTQLVGDVHHGGTGVRLARLSIVIDGSRLLTASVTIWPDIRRSQRPDRRIPSYPADRRSRPPTSQNCFPHPQPSLSAGIPSLALIIFNICLYDTVNFQAIGISSPAFGCSFRSSKNDRSAHAGSEGNPTDPRYLHCIAFGNLLFFIKIYAMHNIIIN